MKDILTSLMKKNLTSYSSLNVSINLKTLLRMILNLNLVTTVRILVEVSWASVGFLSL